MIEDFPPFSKKISWIQQPGRQQPAGEIQAAVKMAWGSGLHLSSTQKNYLYSFEQ